MFSYLLSNGERGLFEEFDRLQREIDGMFGGSTLTNIRGGRATSFPAVNIGSTPEEVHVYVFAPGMSGGDFDVSLQQNVLSIAGNRKPVARENGTWFVRERPDGAFRRVVTLSEDVDPDRVEASYREGVLHLTIKRREAVRPRQIAIN